MGEGFDVFSPARPDSDFSGIFSGIKSTQLLDLTSFLHTGTPMTSTHVTSHPVPTNNTSPCVSHSFFPSSWTDSAEPKSKNSFC